MTLASGKVVALLALAPLFNWPMAPAFKETTPTSFAENDGWKPGQPSDSRLKGNWWTLFQDEQLNQLEIQVDTANQTLKEAEANFRAARAQIGFARSNEAPTIGVGPSISTVRCWPIGSEARVLCSRR